MPEQDSLDARLERIESAVAAVDYSTGEVVDELRKTVSLLTQIAATLDKVAERMPGGD